MIFKSAVCILLAVNAALVGASLYRQIQEKPNDSFIYMTTSFPDEQLTEKLGQVGSRGWDMVFARRASNGNTYAPTFSYEMIFKLPQWAGDRDRATYGIADSYLRMGELPKAQQWFANLKASSRLLLVRLFQEASRGSHILCHLRVAIQHMALC